MTRTGIGTVAATRTSGRGHRDAVTRVEGPDETYLLAAELFGMDAPIQLTWVFDEDPGEDAIESLRAGLAAGPLHRAMARRRVPFARHRWVRSNRPVISVPERTIDDDAVGEWADGRLREVRLDPLGGRGWQLDSARTTSGRRVVSLLASHMITDGQGLYRLLAATAAGETRALPDVPATPRALAEDLADSARALVAAATSTRILVREAYTERAGRRRTAAGTGGVDSPKTTATTTTTTAATTTTTTLTTAITTTTALFDEAVPETTLATVDIDAATWRARAAEHGGTPNTLFTALLAGIVHRSGRRLDGPMKVCIAVSTRDGDDDRANASGGVWIRLPAQVRPNTDLGGIRAASKRAFVEHAESGGSRAADNLQAIVRLLPRRLLARLMRGIPGPDTTVSNLGVTPEAALRIGGCLASRFAIRAVMQGMPAVERRARGPALAAWAVDYQDTTTLTFFGIDPEDFGDPELLLTLISSELAGWGIGHRFW